MTEKYVPTVRELLDDAAAKHGDKTFIEFMRGGKLEERSYAATRLNALAVCRWIRSISAERMHIALVSDTSYEYITCLTGILISGNVAIPFSPDLSVFEAVNLFDRADVDLLLYENAYEARAAQILKSCKTVKQAVNIGDAAYFEAIYRDYGENSPCAALSDIDVDPEACAAMIYTSGTTGVRKAVMLSTRALVGNIMYTDYCTDIFTEESVALSVLPMYHIYCFTGDYLKNMKDGLTVALNGNMHSVLNSLSVFQPRVMRVVPLIAQTLLKVVKSTMLRDKSLTPPEAARKVFGRNLRWMISGGAYLDPALVREYDALGIMLRQGYGMTEAGCRISVPDEGVSMASVGRVIDVCDVRIENGEIQVLTPTRMLGYYKMPEETAAMFTEDGWLKTGDIGTLTEDRELFITGRVKNLIILSNGENVSPEAIEKKFQQLDIVEEVMVYARSDRLVAEVFPNAAYIRDNCIEDVKSVLDKAAEEMNLKAKPSHYITKVILRATPFERTESGKIKRKAPEFAVQ